MQVGQNGIAPNTWDQNTQFLDKRANSRMRIMLHHLVSFNVLVQDLIIIFVLYIRSILEQSCQVWHSSHFRKYLRFRESAKDCIEDYPWWFVSILWKCLTGLKTLSERRNMLCLKFARKCLKNPLVANMFPKNEITYNIETRAIELFKVQFAHSERLKKVQHTLHAKAFEWLLCNHITTNYYC